MKDTQHTPGPWKVMPCPQHHGKHPCHDNRWIATADAEIEWGYDPRPDQWCLSKGSLICEMRDHISAPNANARLIAAAPDTIERLSITTHMLENLVADMRTGKRFGEQAVANVRMVIEANCAAIARATGNQ